MTPKEHWDGEERRKGGSTNNYNYFKHNQEDHDLLISMNQLLIDHIKSFEMHVIDFRLGAQELEKHKEEDNRRFKELYRTQWIAVGIITAIEFFTRFVK